MNREEIQAEIDRLQNLLEEDINEYKPRRLEEDKKYSYINSNLSVSNKFERFSYDDNINYQNFNYFDYYKDKDKAQQYADHIKLQLELFQIRDMINDGWKSDWSNIYQNRYCAYFARNESGSQLMINGLVFGSEEDMKKFIDIVGIDKIKKYVNF